MKPIYSENDNSGRVQSRIFWFLKLDALFNASRRPVWPRTPVYKALAPVATLNATTSITSSPTTSLPSDPDPLNFRP